MQNLSLRNTRSTAVFSRKAQPCAAFSCACYTELCHRCKLTVRIYAARLRSATSGGASSAVAGVEVSIADVLGNCYREG